MSRRKKIAAILGGCTLVVGLVVLALVFSGGDGNPSELATTEGEDGTSAITSADGASGGTSTSDPRSPTASTSVGSSATQAPSSTSPGPSSSPGSPGSTDPPSTGSPGTPGLPAPGLPVPDPTEVLCTSEEYAAIEDAVEQTRSDLEAQKAALEDEIATLRSDIEALEDEISLLGLLDLGLIEELEAEIDDLEAQIEALEAEIAAIEAELATLDELEADAIDLCEAGGDGLSLLE